MFGENDMFRIYFLQLMFVPILGMLRLMKMIFLVSQVLICKFIMMIACLLPMMILMKVGLEECQLYEVVIPLFWRMLNQFVINMKVDLEECQLYLVIPLSWERFRSIMM